MKKLRIIPLIVTLALIASSFSDVSNAKSIDHTKFVKWVYVGHYTCPCSPHTVIYVWAEPAGSPTVITHVSLSLTPTTWLTATGTYNNSNLTVTNCTCNSVCCTPYSGPIVL